MDVYIPADPVNPVKKTLRWSFSATYSLCKRASRNDMHLYIKYL
jgi:hypothetical protein